MVEVQRNTSRCQLGGENLGQRSGEGLDDRHVKAPGAAGGGDLCPDEASPDYADARAAFELRPDGHGIVQGPQDVDPLQIGAAGKPPGSGAGGHDEAVEADGLTVVQDHGPRIEVETGRPLPQFPFDIELVVVGIVPEECLLRLPLAVEDLLGQRRAVVRPEMFLPHHDHLPVKATAA